MGASLKFCPIILISLANLDLGEKTIQENLKILLTGMII